MDITRVMLHGRVVEHQSCPDVVYVDIPCEEIRIRALHDLGEELIHDIGFTDRDVDDVVNFVLERARDKMIVANMALATRMDRDYSRPLDD